MDFFLVTPSMCQARNLTSQLLHYFENTTFCSNFLMKILQFNPTDGIAD
jgi:hypothetical protein